MNSVPLHRYPEMKKMEQFNNHTKLQSSGFSSSDEEIVHIRHGVYLGTFMPGSRILGYETNFMMVL